ncbi:MAG: pyridoxal-phosphate dependent enzyme, partial [Thermoanaerobaculia bacterium]
EVLTREELARRPPGLWRYAELLPVEREEFRAGLGEGGTPLVPARRLGEEVGCPGVFIKDEALNPTGSFKARGLAVAVARAHELGARCLAIPTAGNAGGALSAYAALRGLEAHVFMPRDVPSPFRAECEALGAAVTLVDGLITDCAAGVREGAVRRGWFDLSTLKEPYRLEGKKTLGYELAEQLSGSLPDVIIYPTGGGTGLKYTHLPARAGDG